MYRVEDKYMLSEIDMYEMEKRISSILRPDVHNVEGCGYKISSVYFDDIYDRCLRETLSGDNARSKYRIRIYDDSFDYIQCEVKGKLYNRTLKHGISITKTEMQSLLDGTPIQVDSKRTLKNYDRSDYVKNDINKNSDKDVSVDEMTSSGKLCTDDPRVAFNIALQTRVLRPKVIVTYDRNAYICDEGNVRITFDKNIRASRQIDRFGDSTLMYDYPKDGTGCILEVKYDEYLPDYITQLLENNNMLHTNNSKYVICRQILGDV